MAPDHPRAGVVVEPFSAAGFHDALACCQQRLRRGIAEASPARPGFTSSIWRWMNGRQICVSCGVGVRLPGGRHGMTLAMLDAGLSSSRARSRVLIIRSSACPNVQRTAVPRCPRAARTSPTNMMRACGLPSANTRRVAVDFSAQPSSNFPVARAGPSASARSAPPRADRIGNTQAQGRLPRRARAGSRQPLS